MKDPIGFAGGDSNLCAYVVNDPVNHTDPIGTQSSTSEDGGWSWSDFWRDTSGSAVTGAVSGAVIGAWIGGGSTVVVGGLGVVPGWAAGFLGGAAAGGISGAAFYTSQHAWAGGFVTFPKYPEVPPPGGQPRARKDQTGVLLPSVSTAPCAIGRTTPW